MALYTASCCRMKHHWDDKNVKCECDPQPPFEEKRFSFSELEELEAIP